MEFPVMLRAHQVQIIDVAAGQTGTRVRTTIVQTENLVGIPDPNQHEFAIPNFDENRSVGWTFVQANRLHKRRALFSRLIHSVILVETRKLSSGWQDRLALKSVQPSPRL
jgi:hypothetical protein